MRILNDHGFFGLLLMHIGYAIDENVETACTDGEKITFGVDFLDELSDSELDFVMMHEIMHIVLMHCFRDGDRDSYLFNVACDIVVNSNILLENDMSQKSITLMKYGEAMHLAPDGKEGYNYTAEEVYAMLPGIAKGGKKPGKHDSKGKENGNGIWDDHSRWGSIEISNKDRDIWANRIRSAAEAIEMRNNAKQHGALPLLAQRILGEMRAPQTDWRTILNEFVQEVVVDYSFSPPDKRFGESDFFLPDFNEKDDIVEDILFMIDTSGSMTDEMIAAAYSEILGAIEQFGGKLRGWLGFFDGEVVEPTPFESIEEFSVIRPKGGGGTSFDIIFKHVRKMEKPPASIIILTDGYAPFPNKEKAMGFPVLWLINNEVVTPPWGKVARIKV